MADSTWKLDQILATIISCLKFVFLLEDLFICIESTVKNLMLFLIH